MASTANDVYNYWFSESISEKERLGIWFGGSASVDQYIKEQFGTLIEKARNGELSKWEDLSLGSKHAVAFIILIDQFCRNIYRETPDMFSHGHMSLAVALKLIDAGIHKELNFEERMFVYLPLMHDECQETQKRCVQLHSELYNEAIGTPFENLAKSCFNYAQLHQEVIAKFNRFPKRNQVLGRNNTPEEDEALRNWTYGF
ncbi:uncharacterized protein LOC100213654 isoform X1 [Hydra vulgaris]|uniref:uncharacterized protein LOC100213654 isoform X1 n=1 Tax=Hydra vulgaris TaxID=6087 RepID=UPI001F5F8561|nr:uncharacterized protein LOC100213654 isoform X1 [Hydra vulgaris]